MKLISHKFNFFFIISLFFHFKLLHSTVGLLATCGVTILYLLSMYCWQFPHFHVSRRIDCEKCVICQLDLAEALDLRYPLDSTACDGKKEPYASFLLIVEAFRGINALTVTVAYGPAGTVKNFVKHRAKWHKGCWSNFSNWRLNRARSRNAPPPRSQIARSEKTGLPLELLLLVFSVTCQQDYVMP